MQYAIVFEQFEHSTAQRVVRPAAAQNSFDRFLLQRVNTKKHFFQIQNFRCACGLGVLQKREQVKKRVGRRGMMNLMIDEHGNWD